ncbi:ornithine decarboxylase 1-like [Episyrphus balteatus]|uniref:ornithine decarboxylase 1-like n=1 Tax=Episyrphus balteatus TaxID=286459 RepID=UPI002486A942|nr:ornithine decarboxylase 1-like [Episyrphus balteatus]
MRRVRTPERKPINIYEGTFDLKAKILECSLKDLDASINICDLTSIINKFNDWKRLMPNVEPFYAIKCNDELPVLETLLHLGSGVDCASLKEIEHVLNIGFKPDKILFANPMKNISHIEYAKANNVTDSTVDNEFEIYKIFQHYPESNAVLRFRSDALKAYRSFGKKFGCDAEEDGVALMLVAKALGVNVNGVSFHVGSGCSDLYAYDRAIDTGSNLYKAGIMMKHKMELVDIGGGFPGHNDEMFCEIAEIVNEALKKYMSDVEAKIIAEPGRYFVSAAYTTICRVYSKRELRDKDGELEKIMYYVNDGIYGTFNAIIFEKIKVDTIHFKDENSKTYSSLIFGPTCDAADILCDNIQLPNLKDGDFIAFPNTGAYTVTRSCGFNGFILPKTSYYIRKDMQLL